VERRLAYKQMLSNYHLLVDSDISGIVVGEKELSLIYNHIKWG